MKDNMKELSHDHHDLAKLATRGFMLEEHYVAGKLDGMSATLRLDAGLYLRMFQGCYGKYKLQGQGRGRPKRYVLTDLRWFDPHWAILRRSGDEPERLADGSQIKVDLALDEAMRYYRRLFPDAPITDGIAGAPEGIS